MSENTDDKDMTDPETDVAIDEESADEVSGGHSGAGVRLHGESTRLHGEGKRLHG